jgi:tellurite resistance protein
VHERTASATTAEPFAVLACCISTADGESDLH